MGEYSRNRLLTSGIQAKKKLRKFGFDENISKQRDRNQFNE